MGRRKKIVAEETPVYKAPHRYKIKSTKAGFDLLQDGEWLATFDTEPEAEAEMEHRQAFDRIRGGG